MITWKEMNSMDSTSNDNSKEFILKFNSTSNKINNYRKIVKYEYDKFIIDIELDESDRFISVKSIKNNKFFYDSNKVKNNDKEEIEELLEKYLNEQDD
jgi:hypothetical protein